MSHSFLSAVQLRSADGSAGTHLGNRFDGAVLPGRPVLPATGFLPPAEKIMELACASSSALPPSASQRKCDVLLIISSAAGYERRRRALRRTYLSDVHGRRKQQQQPHDSNKGCSKDKCFGGKVEYRFLVGEAPTAEERAALRAENAEHGDLLFVGVPESYETIFAKVVAAWRWAVAAYEFTFFMHADDDSYVRLDLLLDWVRSPAAIPSQGLYAGYMWDGSEGRRTKPLRDPAQKSYMPIDQWPHGSYPSFASGCGHLIAYDLVAKLVAKSPTMNFFRGGVFDVAIGIYLAGIAAADPKVNLRLLHLDAIRPYRPLPLFRPDTLVQHYMQPEEFQQFHERVVAATAAVGMGKEDQAAATAAESEQRIAAVYDLFVQAKVMRR
jgi:galactosylxylosylprotein 3-beta-galactosyltransferase